MTTDQLPTFNLTVKTSDEFAEIFIIDSRFIRIDNALGGTAVFSLPKGLYTVKVRISSVCEEKSVVLFKDETLVFDSIKFETAAPLDGTTKIHEYHISNAKDHSHTVNLSIGQGSHIYIFARDWTSQSSNVDYHVPKRNPATGLSLYNEHNNFIADIERSSTYITSSDPWAACNIEVDPGIYFLRLETAAGDQIQQTIVTSPGWQTQVFLLLRDYSEVRNIPDFRVDLFNSSIFMARGLDGFQSGSFDKFSDRPDFYLTDITRNALASNRRHVGRDMINRLLDEKFTNPMLGIYAAHLILQDQGADSSLMKIIVKNLRKLVGHMHPDVEAIALEIKEPVNYIFNAPPMLRQSWSYILKASVENPELVPTESIASEIAGKLWNGNPWLLWGSSSRQKEQGIRPEYLKLFLEESNIQLNMQHMPDTGFRQLTPDNNNISFMVESLGVPRARLDSIINDYNFNTSGQKE